jgi:hypothetical protein
MKGQVRTEQGKTRHDTSGQDITSEYNTGQDRTGQKMTIAGQGRTLNTHPTPNFGGIYQIFVFWNTYR